MAGNTAAHNRFQDETRAERIASRRSPHGATSALHTVHTGVNSDLIGTLGIPADWRPGKIHSVRALTGSFRRDFALQISCAARRELIAMHRCR
jgi:hypothetical protein